MRNFATIAIAVAFIGLAVAADRAWADTYWTGSANDGGWTNAANWNDHVPSRTTAEYAIFNGSSTGGSITLGTGSNFRPKNTDFQFLANAPALTLGGADFIDNQSNTRNFTSDSSNNVSFTSNVRIANHNITLTGSGDMSFSKLYNEHAWADGSYDAAAWATSLSDAVLTIGDFQQNRRYNITKSGPGKLAITGVIDFGYGFNGATFVSTLLQTSGPNAGTIDLSAATINLEPHFDLGESLVSGQSYTLVNYANATLINGGTKGFAFVTGDWPAGWGIVNDSANSRIILTQVPEPATLVLLTMGSLAFGRRRRDRAVR